MEPWKESLKKLQMETKGTSDGDNEGTSDRESEGITEGVMLGLPYKSNNVHLGGGYHHTGRCTARCYKEH